MSTSKCRDCDKQCEINSLECSACSQWLHIECTGVTQQKYELISEIINMEKREKKNSKGKSKKVESSYHWYCKFCNKTITDMSKVIGSFDKRIEKLETSVDKVKADITIVKNEMKNKCDTEKVTTLIDNKISNLCDENKVKQIMNSQNINQGPNNSNVSIQDSVKEVEERQIRRTRFLLFNISESKAILKEEINQDNINHVKRLFNLCNIEVNEDILNASNIIRLGKKHIDDNKPRPILVDAKHIETKQEFFRKFIRCISQTGDISLKNIRMAHDLTQIQRVEENRLYAEAKELSKNNLGKQYRVRGPTWDRKILEVFH